MVSKEWMAAIAQVAGKGKMRFLEGATQEQISRFERENGLVFPGQYRQWLMFSDGGELFLPAGVQLYGVAHKPLVDVYDDQRPGDEYVVIGALAWGDPVVFRKGTEQIAIYNLEADQIEEDEVYPDFQAFLMGLPALLGMGG